MPTLVGLRTGMPSENTEPAGATGEAARGARALAAPHTAAKAVARSLDIGGNSGGGGTACGGGDLVRWAGRGGTDGRARCDTSVGREGQQL
jgi:hypothetical protein